MVSVPIDQFQYNEIQPKGPGKRGHIVADTNVPPFARARNICCGHKFCVRDTKSVSDFFQKHFVSATNVSQFCAAQETSWATMCPRLPGPLRILDFANC